MVINLWCWIVGHMPCVEMGEEVEPGVFVGSTRYCGRCWKILEGDIQVGDRRKL